MPKAPKFITSMVLPAMTSATEKKPTETLPKIVPSSIKNKMKREEVYHKQRSEKAHSKLARRKARQRLEKECDDPDALPPKEVPKTLETTREMDETLVAVDDEEVMADEATDDFASYFNGRVPKIVITTSRRPSKHAYLFAEELVDVFPNAELRKRGPTHEIKDIVDAAIQREYTDIIVVNEDRKEPNALLFIHLPNGPTAYFKLTSIKLNKEIHNHGRSTAHTPELILNNFGTRLGHSVGRFFASLFPHVPEFTSRQAVTFHNQRDFIFFRRHRYIFKDGKRANLQEIGPRFTLKLKWLQKGTFDHEFGEYEWMHRPELDTSRRRFFL